MTTVVVANNKVYADGQMTSHMISSYETKKIVNLGKAIVAGAGRWAHVVKFQQWVADTLAAEEVQELNPHVFVNMPEKMVAEDFQGAVLYPDGRVICFEGCDNSFEMKQPVFLGSGAEIAAGCLYACDDGVKAIEAAIHYDSGSGGEIQVEGFDELIELTDEDLVGMDKEQLIAFIKTGEVELPKEDVVYDPESDHYVWAFEFYNEFGDYLNIDHEGFINFGEGNYKNFSVVDKLGSPWFRVYADMLGLKYAHNISLGKLIVRMDNKIKELVDSLDK